MVDVLTFTIVLRKVFKYICKMLKYILKVYVVCYNALLNNLLKHKKQLSKENKMIKQKEKPERVTMTTEDLALLIAQAISLEFEGRIPIEKAFLSGVYYAGREVPAMKRLTTKKLGDIIAVALRYTSRGGMNALRAGRAGAYYADCREIQARSFLNKLTGLTQPEALSGLGDTPSI